ncbi:hypothetical protein FRC08_003358 [Ceratobasidium sp. 394]|nr:hypothetical protein FRC08_003358 [Ceratobasidium sp. 394]KAG9074661.1 hypothetical protein FS749_013754 [Ceratobasidium sp. UAMH 11750]
MQADAFNHAPPPETSPAPASAGAQYLTATFRTPPAHPTFGYNGAPYVFIPVPVAFLPDPLHMTARKAQATDDAAPEAARLWHPLTNNGPDCTDSEPERDSN